MVEARTASDLPIRMLGDRVLLRSQQGEGERLTGGGVLIPGTVTLGKRLGWAAVVAVGQHVRQVELGDEVLFDPAEHAEVELDDARFVLVRERDLHAVRTPHVEDATAGVYL